VVLLGGHAATLYDRLRGGLVAHAATNKRRDAVEDPFEAEHELVVGLVVARERLRLPPRAGSEWRRAPRRP
jgi:hypothetical protein